MKKSTPATHNEGAVSMLVIVGIVVAMAAAGGAYYFYNHHSGSFKTADGQVVKYAQNGDELTFGDKNGKLATGDNLKLPKDFPQDVPVYPGAKIESYMYELPSVILIQTTKDDTSKIMAWHEEAFIKEGWTLELKASTSLTATKGDLAAGMGVNDNEDGTRSVTVSVMEKSGMGLTTSDGEEDFDKVMEEGKQQFQEWQDQGWLDEEDITIYDNE